MARSFQEISRLSCRSRWLTGILLFLSIFPSNTVASDVQLQPDSYLAYVPSLPGNTIVAIIYSLLFFALMYHTLFTGKKVDKWALVLPIGTFFAALGYWLRLPMRKSQSNEPLYTVMYLFVVLSPATFLAFNYIAFGRLTAALEGNKPTEIKNRSKYLFIPPRFVKLIFVLSDVCTFCIQAAGGGMQTSDDIQTANLGNTIFLVGVSAQGGSYLLFSILVLVAHYRLLNKRKDGKRFVPWNLKEPTSVFLNLLYISSIGIIVRSVYRIIEMKQGYNGYLYSNEIFTFTLDALPLFFAIGAWAFYWPGLLINSIRQEAASKGDLENYGNSTSTSSPDHQLDRNPIEPTSETHSIQ